MINNFSSYQPCSDQKKIVHVIPTFELGGVQTGILYSLEDINKKFEYTILVIGKVDTEWLLNLSPTIREHIIFTGSTKLLPGWIRGYRMLKKIKPDFIITSLWKSVGLSATYKLLHRKTWLGGFFHSAYSPHFASTFFMKLLSYAQDVSFADSSITKEFLESFYKIKNTHIIPYLFNFTQKKGHKKFSSPEGIRMAYFGRISKAKGIDRSLEFCRVLKDSGIKFIFEIYGEGPLDFYQAKIKTLMLEKEVTLKKTLPLNLVLERMNYYDFLLQLSNYEGMALSVVEAMNMGLVPVVTPVGEIKRYSLDGINAIWLNQPFDSNLAELSDKLKKLISNPDLYYKISSAAASTFINYKKYGDTLIEVIDGYLHSEKDVKLARNKSLKV